MVALSIGDDANTALRWGIALVAVADRRGRRSIVSKRRPIAVGDGRTVEDVRRLTCGPQRTPSAVARRGSLVLPEGPGRPDRTPVAGS